MTQQEILEYNKKCAKLLGYTFKYYTDDKNKKTIDLNFVWGSEAKIFKQYNAWWRCTLTPNNNFSWCFPNDLKFHSDWNWIMLVKSTIVDLELTISPSIHRLYFNTFACRKSHKAIEFIYKVRIHSDFKDIEFKSESNDEKEAVVQAINQFLIWYNENKTN